MICLGFVDLISTLVYLMLGAIMYPGNQQYILISANGEAVIARVYLPVSVPHYALSTGIYPNQAGISRIGAAAQVSSTTHYPNQVVPTDASTGGPMQGAASVTSDHHQYIKKSDNLVIYLKIIDIMCQQIKIKY